ncbi:branched-chain-amino-acid aminotransferase-like protein 1 [Euphorbia lathyris]|uniref:branched-chain-amino-acid aminotransferase-like protein 1 n=1 Tax=Euphorbia lathyris TaxID=212925 RepID=UPI0033139E95
MAEPMLDSSVPPGLHLISAFLAMEITDTFISLARACGGGLVTERVQRFIWDNCISAAMGEGKEAYVKNIVKKLIFEVESSQGTVLDELYERYSYYMTSLKDDTCKANVRVCKCISFIFPDGCFGIPSCPKLRKLVVPLHSSLNMLEGDTGCSIWPSSLYLSEFILSFPENFSNKSCFEVGSGVGLVGICLSHVKASEVVLSDGDLSTLANMKLNLDLNHLKADTSMPKRSMPDLDTVHCIHLPWESARKTELQEFMPDIVLGADIIYDPSCLPYLVQVLDILLNKVKTCSGTPKDEYQVSEPDPNCVAVQAEGLHYDSSNAEQKKRPVAYVASVIRNIDTFNCFLQLAEQANLTVTDITERQKPLDLLPYMQSYKRSSIRLFCVVGKQKGSQKTDDPSIPRNTGRERSGKQSQFHVSAKPHALQAYSAAISSRPRKPCFLSRVRVPRAVIFADVTISLSIYTHPDDCILLHFLSFLKAPVIHSTLPQKREKRDTNRRIMEGGSKNEVELIHSWSAPRSLSTSLLYSFAQRNDTEVLDEPLYANYLKVTGVDRPYDDEVLSKLELESDGSKVVREVIYGPGEKKYRFCKNISKQRLPGLPSDLMKKGKHFILIRNPLDILPSFEKVVPPSFLELGFAELVSIYSDLSKLGKPPAVIDSADLEQDAEGTLRGLCEDLDIPFDEKMLSWEAGPKSIDGPWASWWYKSVHQSTGFQKTKKYPEPFPFSLYDLLEQSLPLYNMLRRHVRKTTALLKSPLPPPELPFPKNEKLLAWVGDEIVPRESAKVSVFDSVVQGGDSVWEGLRIYKRRIFKLEEHLDRLFDSAKALDFKNVPTRVEVKEAIFRTLIRNGMFDDAHIRLSLTRGKKVTSGMSPEFNLYGCTLIVLPEWKPPVYDNTHGIVLVAATTRRNSPNTLDSKIHHNNLLNNILAKVEGNNAGAADAIMLDKDGFVSETNATNIFLVKKGRVCTPHADYCLPGITRATVIDLVVKELLVLEERRISLSELHTAEEVWTTGTMGELTPVVKIDARLIGDGKVGKVTQRLQVAYKKVTANSGVPIPSN